MTYAKANYNIGKRYDTVQAADKIIPLFGSLLTAIFNFSRAFQGTVPEETRNRSERKRTVPIKKGNQFDSPFLYPS